MNIFKNKFKLHPVYSPGNRDSSRMYCFDCRLKQDQPSTIP